MKRIFSVIFIFLIFLCGCSNSTKSDDTLEDTTSNYRYYFRNQVKENPTLANVELTRISMLGSHNTFSDKITELSYADSADSSNICNNAFIRIFGKDLLPRLTICQNDDCYTQLMCGTRYLDVRVGIEYVCGEPIMTIYHGFVNCLDEGTIFSSHLYLDSVIDSCVTFLKENPTETIIFVVKQEHGDESIQEFETLLNSYIETNKDTWLLTDTMPTLGEARGKIVLFRRYEDEANLGSSSGIYLNWSQQNEAPDTDLVFEEVSENAVTTYVQDRYKFDEETKWTVFQKTLNESANLVSSGNIVINFLSTNGTATYGHPYKYSKILNEQLLALDDSSINAGWIIVDFGNANLAQKIYQNN